MAQETYTGDPAVLSCWKDIAKYLGKGVRTVQRWEREFELPVLRPKGAHRKSAVTAHPRDLDAWLTSRWALRAAKETAEPVEGAVGLIGRKAAIQERIDTGRALREKQTYLIHELSDVMQMLIQNCDLLSRGGMPNNSQAQESSSSTGREHYSGLGSELVPLPPLIESQRESGDVHRRSIRRTDAI